MMASHCDKLRKYFKLKDKGSFKVSYLKHHIEFMYVPYVCEVTYTEFY